MIRHVDKRIRITDSTKQRIAKKAKTAEEKLKKANSKESIWVVRKLKELWQKVTQPHVLKAAAVALISSAVSAAIAATKERFRAHRELLREQGRLEGEVETLRAQLISEREDLRDNQQEVELLARRNAGLRTQIQQEEMRAEAVMRERNSLNERLNEMNSELQRARESARARESTIRREAEVKLNSAREEERNSAREEAGRLRQQILATQLSLERVREQLANNTAEGAEINAGLESMRQRLRETTTEFRRRQDIVRTVENRIQELSSDYREEVQRVLNIHQRAIQTQQEIAAYNQTVQMLNPEGEQIRREVENRSPVQVPGADPRASSFSEAGRYHEIAGESVASSGRAGGNRNFSETSNRFSSIVGRNAPNRQANRVNRLAFSNVRRNGRGVDELLERARTNNAIARSNVFSERSNRYSSLELDSAYNLWLSQFRRGR